MLWCVDTVTVVAGGFITQRYGALIIPRGRLRKLVALLFGGVHLMFVEGLVGLLNVNL